MNFFSVNTKWKTKRKQKNNVWKSYDFLLLSTSTFGFLNKHEKPNMTKLSFEKTRVRSLKKVYFYTKYQFGYYCSKHIVKQALCQSNWYDISCKWYLYSVCWKIFINYTPCDSRLLRKGTYSMVPAIAK